MQDETSTEATPTMVRPSPEFYQRINDFIAMANRIARRSNTATAQMVMLQAVGRYAAHHYSKNGKPDDEQELAEYSNFIGKRMTELVLFNVRQMRGSKGSEAPAATPGSEPAEG